MSAGAGCVRRLWRYPVKSMAGEATAQLEVAAAGVAGDRVYAVRTADGRFGSGKSTVRFRQIDGLLGFAARWCGAALEIRFPDGRAFDAHAPGVDAALSEALGQPVTLVSAPAAHVDAGPVHVLTSASLAWLRARLPGARIDERRFRPNIVLDAPGDRPLEQAWLERRLTFAGGVRLHIEAPTERCRMVTLGQAGLPDDVRVLGTLGESADLMFGVYAAVEAPGRIALGEAVEVL